MFKITSVFQDVDWTKSIVFIMGLSFYMTWSLSYPLVYILFCELSSLTMIFGEEFLFWSSLFNILWCFSICVGISYPRYRFFSIILCKFFHVLLSWKSSLLIIFNFFLCLKVLALILKLILIGWCNYFLFPLCLDL